MPEAGQPVHSGFSPGSALSYPCCSVLGMDGSTDRSARRATELIDELVVGHRALARAQAWCAALMMEFAETRTVCDRKVIAEREAAGVEARYKAGGFAGLEISMALRESKYAVQRTMVVARRLRADTPDAWDAWLAGDITYDKAERISRTLGRLVRDSSKSLLNHVVVDVAVCKTGELLGRWLNQFVARIEPDEQDERIGRSLADRYVSVRPDLDGVSFLSAALSSMDAASIDRVLTAIAAVADPGDTRTMQQRRADALVDVLLGRISNGCHTRWDGVEDNGVEEDGFDEDGSEDNDFDDEQADGVAAAKGWDTLPIRSQHPTVPMPTPMLSPTPPQTPGIPTPTPKATPMWMPLATPMWLAMPLRLTMSISKRTVLGTPTTMTTPPTPTPTTRTTPPRNPSPTMWTSMTGTCRRRHSAPIHPAATTAP